VSIRPTDLVLLDTSVLVHCLREDATGKLLRQNYELEDRPERPLFCTVTEGELRGLAHCWKWGLRRIRALEDLLCDLVRVESSHPAIVAAYAELYFEDQRSGRNTGENDLWIAATAKAAAAALLTCDKGFQWMSPTLLRVEYVSESH
jgi:predicted nucleic acid-binding protein